MKPSTIPSGFSSLKPSHVSSSPSRHVTLSLATIPHATIKSKAPLPSIVPSSSRPEPSNSPSSDFTKLLSPVIAHTTIRSIPPSSSSIPLSKSLNPTDVEIPQHRSDEPSSSNIMNHPSILPSVSRTFYWSSPSFSPIDKKNREPSNQPIPSVNSSPMPTAIMPSTYIHNDNNTMKKESHLVMDNTTVHIAIESIESMGLIEDEIKTIFEEITLQFLNEAKLVVEGISVDFISVQVISQQIQKDGSGGLVDYPFRKLYEQTRNPTGIRSLQLRQINTLIVGLVITGVVKSKAHNNSRFDFIEACSYAFQHHFLNFIDRLRSSAELKSSLFSTKVPDKVNVPNKTNDENTNLIIILSVCLAAAGFVSISFWLFQMRRDSISKLRNITYGSKKVVRDVVHPQKTNSMESDISKHKIERQDGVIDPSRLPGHLQQQTSESDTKSDISLGLNLSPEAIFEAQKQFQTFTFIADNCGSSNVTDESMNASTVLSPRNDTSLLESDIDRQQKKYQRRISVVSIPTRHESPSSISNKKERVIYDCYAPSGQLGIIVESTNEGPMVHSIKPTSPLIGLVSPGDLIKMLDDIDTTSMSAPMLTQLMVKLSKQNQRKLTLQEMM